MGFPTQKAHTRVSQTYIYIVREPSFQQNTTSRMRSKHFIWNSLVLFVFHFFIGFVAVHNLKLQISVNGTLAFSTDGLQTFYCSASCHWNESFFMAQSDECRIPIRGLVGLALSSMGHDYLRKAFTQLSQDYIIGGVRVIP